MWFLYQADPQMVQHIRQSIPTACEEQSYGATMFVANNRLKKQLFGLIRSHLVGYETVERWQWDSSDPAEALRKDRWANRDGPLHDTWTARIILRYLWFGGGNKNWWQKGLYRKLAMWVRGCKGACCWSNYRDAVRNCCTSQGCMQYELHRSSPWLELWLQGRNTGQ